MIVGKVYVINCTAQELPIRINRGNPQLLTPARLRLIQNRKGKGASKGNIEFPDEAEEIPEKAVPKLEPSRKALTRIEDPIEIVAPEVIAGPGWLAVSRSPETRQDLFGPVNSMEVLVPGRHALYESVDIAFDRWPIIQDLQLFIYYTAAILSAEGQIVWSSAAQS